MKRRVLCLLLSLCLLTLPVRAEGVQDPVRTRLEQMSTQEKIAQMIMPTFRTDPGRDSGIGEDVAECLREYGFAGVALFAEELETTAQAVRRTDAMQAANAARPGRPQLLLAVDQEGGMITRLGQGTMTCGNMALGAVDDPEATGQAAGILGSEIMACGLNVDFAPVLDVNSNPANPVIGIRSFSDDPETAARHGAAFLQAMQRTGAVACLKHFPGHGDTGTDSHTGLPRVDKSLDALLSGDLIPFARCIGAGAEMIMTAHIQYPAVETNTWTSKATGEPITLPATLYETVITGLLRGTLGYEGVVITDALNMDAISEHFTPEDSARLAIEAGVDILLTPPVSTAGLGGYIERLSAMADAGEISMEKVDAAVARILRLKQCHGLLEPYGAGRLDERLEAAAIVGSAAHHETEWEIAMRAVTMVKNDGVLPYPDPGARTVVLTAYDNEIQSMAYALSRLREDDLLPKNADIEILSMEGTSAQMLAEWIDGADHVVAVSELRGSAGLYGSAAARLDALIASAHDNGADVTVISANLPYDCARYPDADAVLLCWLDRSMSEDPREAESGVVQYGPNLPAALYLLLSGQSPRGRLSVDIPALDGGGYAEEILYPRGFGLRYPGAEDEPVEETPVIIDDFGDDVEETVEYHSDIHAYRDVNGRAWFFDDIKCAVESGWMTGVSEAAFSPGARITGEEAIDALARCAGAGRPIAWARERGLLEGLRAGEPVTRRQLAALLARCAGEESGTDAMVWAQAHSLFRPRVRSVPDVPVTRAVLAHALCALRDAGFGSYRQS